jgi:VWFA-related protein
MLRLATLLVLSANLCSPLFAQTLNPVNPEQVYRVKVDLVVIDAQVVNPKSHRPVMEMKPEDFELFDDKMKQQITSFSQDKLPLSVVFLFDLTDSVRPVLKPLAEGALKALQHLKPEDEAAVMVYSASTQLLQDFTTDRELIVQAIHRASDMESGEAAFFNEAIFQSARQLTKASNPASRRVIIWLTDNIPNVPSQEVRWRYARSLSPTAVVHSEHDAMQELFKTGTMVCTLLNRSRISEDEFIHRLSDTNYRLESGMYPPGDVRKYTEQTGGEIVEAESSRHISMRLADLIDGLRTRYALGFHPAKSSTGNGFHPIKLRIAEEAMKREGKLVVKARRGYWREESGYR